MSTKYGIREFENEFGRPTFGQILQSWRLSDELSLKEMALKLGITPSSLCDLEKGRRIPSITRVKKLARILGVSEKVWIKHVLQDQLDRSNTRYKVHLTNED